MKVRDDWAGDGNISIIPAACLMLEAGVAIAAIRSQLARLAIIDPFLLLSSIQIFFHQSLTQRHTSGSCRQTNATHFTPPRLG
jgi:hypothetical protein